MLIQAHLSLRALIINRPLRPILGLFGVGSDTKLRRKPTSCLVESHVVKVVSIDQVLEAVTQCC